MKNSKTSLARWAGLALTGLLTLGASTMAQANDDDLLWSIAMSSPGVRVSIANGHILALPPVYAPHPRVVYTPVYRVHPGYYSHGHGHGYSRGGHYGGHDRHDRHGHQARNNDRRGHGGDHRGHQSHGGGRGGQSGPAMNMGRNR